MLARSGEPRFDQHIAALPWVSIALPAGTNEVWKHDLNSGVDVQVTHHGGFNPIESVDGKTVFYSRFNEAGIWSIPVFGGSETIVIPDRPQNRFWGHYAVATTGLYLLDNDAEPRPAIEAYDFASRTFRK